jgi:ribosome recycling factor
MVDEIVKNADEKFNTAIELLVNDLADIRAGRPSTKAIENILVDYYGAKTPIKALANITLSGPRNIQITPYDKSQIQTIEKTLSDNPNTQGTLSDDGNNIFINLPELTTEKRQDYVKLAKEKAEKAKIATRTIRHNLYKSIDEFKDKSSEDDIRNAKNDIDKKLGNITSKIDSLSKEKESQILE